MKVIDHGISPNLFAIIDGIKQTRVVMHWAARRRPCWQTGVILHTFSDTGKCGTFYTLLPQFVSTKSTVR